MYLQLPILLSLIACVTTTPAPDRAQHDHAKRQNGADLGQLLQLASEAGVPLPTDKAALLSLGPVANQLASALPTAPVLSVLQTAAPSGFISQIVHDPAYASSFEAAFAAGSSPSWFNALPTDVKSYLHTYTNYAGIATAVGSVDAVNANQTKAASGSGKMTSSASMTSSKTGSASANAASSSGAGPTSTSTGGAPAQTGVLAVGILGAVGVLGLAVAL